MQRIRPLTPLTPLLIPLTPLTSDPPSDPLTQTAGVVGSILTADGGALLIKESSYNFLNISTNCSLFYHIFSYLLLGN